MKQPDLERAYRDEGRDRVEIKHETWLTLARRFAVMFSAKTGSVSIVHVHDWAERTGQYPDDPLAYSAVFKGKQWRPTGEMMQSRHEGGHARKVMLWKYVSTVY
jgi:hypothetical protein